MRTILHTIGMTAAVAAGCFSLAAPAIAARYNDDADGRYYYDSYGRRYYDDYTTNTRYYNDDRYRSGQQLYNFVCYYYDAAGQCTNYSYTENRSGNRTYRDYSNWYDDYPTRSTTCEERYGYGSSRCRTSSGNSDYRRGYEEGYDDGYDDGRRSRSGNSAEYDRGYREGYDDGYRDGRLRSSYYGY